MVQWRGRRRSQNVEDMRGASPGRRSMRAGGLRLGGGMGTIGIIAVVVIMLMGGDPSQLLNMLLGSGGSTNSPVPQTRVDPSKPVGDDDGAQFVSVILADTEQTWGRLFQASGSRYPEPKLRLFTDAVNSACGFNSAAVGPFYCPPDQRVYLDLSFFNQLERLGAPGDFAQAYVIGHEVGHHVQNVTGILPKVQQLKQGRPQREANQLQVLIELQADCYAGVWAHHAESERDLLENGDIEEGLQAAASIGDDSLQRRAGGRVQPESFTHGSSAQRVDWFKRGFRGGNVADCDTFKQANIRVSNDAWQTQARKLPANVHDVHHVIANRLSDTQITGSGRVIKVLPDDRDGSRHQRFILDVGQGKTLLVAHNIDLAERLKGIREGDVVEYLGEYEYNNRGGVLHWTHHDPAGRHMNGWLKHANQTYQ